MRYLMHDMHETSSGKTAPCAFARKRAARDYSCMNLKAIRQARGLTQAQLAEMVGVDQSTITRAEAMHESAKLATYSRCAEVLGVTLADLFADSRSAIEARVLLAFRALPISRHDELLQLMHLARASDQP